MHCLPNPWPPPANYGAHVLYTIPFPEFEIYTPAEIAATACCSLRKRFTLASRATEGREELYDLATDPEEKEDLITKRFDIAAGLRPEILKASQTQRDWYLKYRGR